MAEQPMLMANPPHSATQSPRSITPRDVFFEVCLIVARRRWLIAAVFLLVFSGLFISTYLQPPLYKATAGILVHQNPRNQPILFKDLTGPVIPDQRTKPAKNLIEIARSFDLARRIVQEYDLHTRLEQRTTSPQNLRERINYWLGRILSSPIDLLIMLGIFDASEPSYEFMAANEFREDSLDIFLVHDTELVMLSVWEESPSLAVSIADTLSQLLIDKAVSQAQTKTSTAYVFAEEQVALAKQELAETEARETELQQRLSLYDAAQQRTLLIDRLERLRDRYDNRTDERTRLISRKDSLERQLKDLDREVLSSTTWTANPLVTELRAEQSRTELEIASHRNEWRSGNAEMIALRARAEKIAEQLEAAKTTIVQNETYAINPLRQSVSSELMEVERELHSLSGNSVLQEQILALEQELADLTAHDDLLRSTQRDRKTQEDIYLTLQEKVAALRAQAVNRLSEFDIQIFDEPYLPTNADAAYPEWDVTFAIALAAGLVLGLFSALIVHYLDDRYVAARSLERDFAGIVIGAVPVLR